MRTPPPMPTPEVLSVSPQRELSIHTAVRSCQDIQELQRSLVGALIQLQIKDQVIAHIIKG